MIQLAEQFRVAVVSRKLKKNNTKTIKMVIELKKQLWGILMNFLMLKLGDLPDGIFLSVIKKRGKQ